VLQNTFLAGSHALHPIKLVIHGSNHCLMSSARPILRALAQDNAPPSVIGSQSLLPIQLLLVHHHNSLTLDLATFYQIKQLRDLV
jgi:hypothetical protein